MKKEGYSIQQKIRLQSSQGRCFQSVKTSLGAIMQCSAETQVKFENLPVVPNQKNSQNNLYLTMFNIVSM